MNLCELSNDARLVIPVYLLALLPWTVLSLAVLSLAVLSLVDPINIHWKSFRKVLFYSIVHAIASFVPYVPLMFYAVAQTCAKKPDWNEFMTTIVAIIISPWNTRRSIRGFLALNHVRKIWQSVDYPNKCLLRNVLVSSALVDNDWPGESPKVAYISELLLR